MKDANNAGNLLPIVQEFNYSTNNQPIRVEVIDNEPWFVAKDVCRILGIINHIDAIKRLDDDERMGSVISTPSGKQEINIISESGLYSLIFQSRKKEAKAFRKWVTAEVLPTIRKTGSYSAKQYKGMIPYARQGEWIDLRNTAFYRHEINNYYIKVVKYDNDNWYHIADTYRACFKRTNANSVAKALNFDDNKSAIRILLFGQTQPAWFVNQNGFDIIMSNINKKILNKIC